MSAFDSSACRWAQSAPTDSYWWAQRVMGKKNCCFFLLWHRHGGDRWGKQWRSVFSFFLFLWMERNNRLRGTLMVLRNPIHMAPCTRETSDNQETACQEDNNSSPFNLITATGTYNSTRAGVHWAAGAANKKKILSEHGTAAPSWSVTCSIVALWGWCNSDARGKITPRKNTSVGIGKRSLGSGRVKQNKAGSWLPRRHVSGLRRGSSQGTEIMCSVKKPGVFWGLLVYFNLHNWKVPHADSLESLKNIL